MRKLLLAAATLVGLNAAAVAATVPSGGGIWEADNCSAVLRVIEWDASDRDDSEAAQTFRAYADAFAFLATAVRKKRGIEREERIFYLNLAIAWRELQDDPGFKDLVEHCVRAAENLKKEGGQ